MEKVPNTEDHVFVIPRVEEDLKIETRQIETGKVQLRKSVEHETISWDEPTTKERIEVRRIPIGERIDSAPGIRVEGDTTVIPVVEEIIEVVKRLVLKEEIHVRRITEYATQTLSAEVRRERVEIRRSGLSIQKPTTPQE